MPSSGKKSKIQSTDSGYYIKPADTNYKSPNLGAFTVLHGTHPDTGETVYLLALRAATILVSEDGEPIGDPVDNAYGLPGGGFKDEEEAAYLLAETEGNQERMRALAVQATIDEIQEELRYEDSRPILSSLDSERFVLELDGNDPKGALKCHWHAFSYALSAEEMAALVSMDVRLNADPENTKTILARESFVAANDLEIETFKLCTASEVMQVLSDGKVEFAYPHERNALEAIVKKNEEQIGARDNQDFGSQSAKITGFTLTRT